MRKRKLSEGILVLSSIWQWPSFSMAPLGYCLTLTRKKSIDQVLNAYGAADHEVSQLTHRQAAALLHPCSNIALRVGLVGDCAFCFEEGDVLGIGREIQQSLSAGSETFTLCNTPEKGMVTVSQMRDGQSVGGFEVGMELPLSQQSSWSREADRLLAAGGMTKVQVALEIASDWAGAPFPWESTMGGELATVFLPVTHHQPPGLPMTATRPAWTSLGQELSSMGGHLQSPQLDD